MTSKKKPESKNSFNESSVRKHNISRVYKKFETSFFKKNEFIVIITAALVITAVIFFLFFRSPDSKSDIDAQKDAGVSFNDFAQRLEAIEHILKVKKGVEADPDQIEESMNQIEDIEKRVARIESILSVKLEPLTQRLSRAEKTILSLKKGVSKAIVNKGPEPELDMAVKTSVKKAVGKIPAFHTVQKKETLYSISRKYNTTIAKLRQLNKLSKNGIIYPGDKLMLR